MKYIAIISIIATLMLQACGPKEKSADSIREKISTYKSKITNLNNKIHDLEMQLEQDSMAVDGFDYSVPVKIDTLYTTVFNHYLEVGGTVEAINEAFISPEVNGRIKRIYVREGQFVAKGTLLARLNTDITESSIEEIKTNLRLAEVMYKKQKELWDQHIGSEIQYLQAKSNKESLEARLKTMRAQMGMASIRAPFSGIVDEIFRKEGELAIPGVQLIRLINLKNIIVSADMAETYISDIKAGDIVSIEFPAYGDELHEAAISRTGNVISTNNRTFSIEIRMKNMNNSLKPNSMALVHVNDYSHEDAISVPSIIIKQDVNKGFFLFVVDQNTDGKLVANKRYVITGKSFAGQTEILSGLQAGELVIIEGYNTVANGTLINIL